MEWEVDDAENRLGDLLDSVDEHGPQQIRHRGKVYILSAGSSEEVKPRNRLVELLVNGPNWEGVPVERIPGKMRDVEL